jgi:hypothetical protein
MFRQKINRWGGELSEESVEIAVGDYTAVFFLFSNEVQIELRLEGDLVFEHHRTPADVGPFFRLRELARLYSKWATDVIWDYTRGLGDAEFRNQHTGKWVKTVGGKNEDD